METDTDAASPDAVAERLLGAALGTVDLMAAFLGDRLGWYRSLAEDGPGTPLQLAERTRTDARYAREWLEQQAVTGLLRLDSDGAEDERVFSIPPGTAEVMTDQHSLSFLAPVARMFGAIGPASPGSSRHTAPATASAGTSSATMPVRDRPTRTGRGSSTGWPAP